MILGILVGRSNKAKGIDTKTPVATEASAAPAPDIADGVTIETSEEANVLEEVESAIGSAVQAAEAEEAAAEETPAEVEAPEVEAAAEEIPQVKVETSSAEAAETGLENVVEAVEEIAPVVEEDVNSSSSSEEE